MSSLKEARANYLSEWMGLSLALRSASDSAHAYVNKLKEEGKNPDTLEIPIILPQVETGKKRKGAADDEEKPKTGKGSRGGKKIKDPNAPKRPPSAYILFQNTIRTKTREENPDIPYADVMKIIGERWNKLTEDEKKPFNDEANTNMAKFKVEEEDYKAKGGKIGTPSPAPEEPTPQTAKKSKKEKEKKLAKPPTPSSSEDESDEGSPAKHGKKPTDDSDDSSSDEEPTAPPPKKAKVSSPVKASNSKPRSDKSSKHESKSEPKSKSKDSHAHESSKGSSKDKKEKKRKSQASE